MPLLACWDNLFLEVVETFKEAAIFESLKQKKIFRVASGTFQSEKGRAVIRALVLEQLGRAAVLLRATLIAQSTTEGLHAAG